MREVGERRTNMLAGGPEWSSLIIVDAVVYTDDGPRPVRLHIGVVQLPDRGGTRLASQLAEEGRDLVFLPPHSVTKIMGVLREWLRSLSEL